MATRNFIPDPTYRKGAVLRPRCTADQVCLKSLFFFRVLKLIFHRLEHAPILPNII